jgi:hypothetical protein
MKNFLSVVMVMAILMLGPGYAFSGTYLVYDPGGSQDNVSAAMTSLGYTYDVRNASNVVTSVDLTSGAYEALVIGWSVDGDYSGLTPSALEGITGNKVLTGHDADYHTYYGVDAAETFMQRIVDFSGSASATGIVAFTDYNYSSAPFSYLPDSWGIEAVGGLSEEIITGITADGVASGFYTGLSLGDLSNWGQSFHSYFTSYDPSFKSFELGAYGGSDERVITIGTTVTPYSTPEPATLLLIGLGLMGLAGVRRKIK